MSENSGVRSLSKALSILSAVAASDRPASAGEIAARTGLPRATVYRLIDTLRVEGYLFEPQSGRFTVGFELLPIAASLLDSNPLRLDAMPHLQDLSRETGERTNLGILYRGNVLLLAGFERPSLPTIYSRFGRRVPIHCSGLGKAVLSQLSPAEVAAILGDAPLEARTPRTITDRARLAVELQDIRARGYAREHGENSPHSCCIAAPLVWGESRVIGAISISGRDPESVERHVPSLLAAAEKISHVARENYYPLEIALPMTRDGAQPLPEGAR